MHETEGTMHFINKHAQKLSATTKFSYNDIVYAMKLIEENKKISVDIEIAWKMATMYGFNSVYAFVAYVKKQMEDAKMFEKIRKIGGIKDV